MKKNLLPLRRGDTVLLPADALVWWNKSSEDIEAEHQRNLREGRVFDSAGEPLLVSPMGRLRLRVPTFALVTKTRGIIWTDWVRRPRHLVEALITLEDGTPRYVVIRQPPLQSIGKT